MSIYVAYVLHRYLWRIASLDDNVALIPVENYVDGLMQHCSNSSALAMAIL